MQQKSERAFGVKDWVRDIRNDIYKEIPVLNTNSVFELPLLFSSLLCHRLVQLGSKCVCATTTLSPKCEKKRGRSRIRHMRANTKMILGIRDAASTSILAS